jgi:uncharacterized protein YndB with AHSA1/START domain
MSLTIEGTKPTVNHNTFVIQRSYSAAPEQVFAAFSDPVKKRRWFAESDAHEVEVFDMDFRVGGRELTTYRFKPGTPFPGVPLVNQSVYQDIVPGRRIVFAATMTLGDRRISATLVTAELIPAGAGTTLVLTHQGAFFEGSDGPEMREAGWNSLLDKLGRALSL